MRDTKGFCWHRFVMIVALGTAACGSESPSGPRPDVSPRSATPSNAGSSASDSQGDVLRVRTDRPRSRVWILALDEVRVHDLVDRRLIRRIALPPWSVAAGLCMPDMVLDRSGSAVISSNADPVLFRIDAADLRLSQHVVRLRGKENWAIGFGALGFDSAGVLHGLVASGNSLWRIDAAKGIAERIESYDPPLDRCALAMHAQRLP